jgi:hypothetical protein
MINTICETCEKKPKYCGVCPNDELSRVVNGYGLTELNVTDAKQNSKGWRLEINGLGKPKGISLQSALNNYIA